MCRQAGLGLAGACLHHHCMRSAREAGLATRQATGEPRAALAQRSTSNPSALHPKPGLLACRHKHIKKSHKLPVLSPAAKKKVETLCPPQPCRSRPAVLPLHAHLPEPLLLGAAPPLLCWQAALRAHPPVLPLYPAGGRACMWVLSSLPVNLLAGRQGWPVKPRPARANGLCNRRLCTLTCRQVGAGSTDRWVPVVTAGGCWPR